MVTVDTKNSCRVSNTYIPRESGVMFFPRVIGPAITHETNHKVRKHARKETNIISSGLSNNKRHTYKCTSEKKGTGPNLRERRLGYK